MFDVSKIYTYIRPTDKIEFGYFFNPEDIYSVDGWYSCPETGGEWYITNSKIAFSLDNYSPDYKQNIRYYSNIFGFLNSKAKCERLLKLKPFW